jgi:hypothetical protein
MSEEYTEIGGRGCMWKGGSFLCLSLECDGWSSG